MDLRTEIEILETQAAGIKAVSRKLGSSTGVVVVKEVDTEDFEKSVDLLRELQYLDLDYEIKNDEDGRRRFSVYTQNLRICVVETKNGESSIPF